MSSEIKFVFTMITVFMISATNAYSDTTLQLDANCRNSLNNFLYDSNMYPTEVNFTTTKVSVYVNAKVDKSWNSSAMDKLPVQVTYSLAWNDPRLAYGNQPGLSNVAKLSM